MAEKKKDTVTMTVQRRYEKDARRYVCVNGEACSIATGKPGEIPRKMARVIRQSEDQREANRKLTEKLNKQANEMK